MAAFHPHNLLPQALASSARACTFEPAMAIRSHMHSTVLSLQLRQATSQNKCGRRRRILAQLQQEMPSITTQHLERCLEADAGGAAELASSASTAQQRKECVEVMRVVYQGNAGGYSHAVVEEVYGAAAAAHAGGANLEAIPCREMEGAFTAVETWVGDAALIPIQNNLDGSIHRNYDLLLRHAGLHIVGEVLWHVNHCLLGHPRAASISHLRQVIGHPQALSHCSHTLADLGLPTGEEEEDTTNAALLVASSPSTALVASSQAARVFGLQIMRSSIQDDAHNITRFLQLARRPSTPPSPVVPCKTTIAFALRKGPTDLCKVMSAFALRDIRVTNLESRPRPASQLAQSRLQGMMSYRDDDEMQGQQLTTATQFEYVFFVDIEASTGSQHTQRALRQVEELSSFYRVLGSYPLVHHCQPAMQMCSQHKKS